VYWHIEIDQIHIPGVISNEILLLMLSVYLLRRCKMYIQQCSRL